MLYRGVKVSLFMRLVSRIILFHVGTDEIKIHLLLRLNGRFTSSHVGIGE